MKEETTIHDDIKAMQSTIVDMQKINEKSIEIVKEINEELDKCWIVNQQDCAKYLTDDEFEQLQGLIKKVDVLKENDG